MIVVPINLNRIEIPTVRSGCCKIQFDSTYPAQLNGIITQAEFQESIDTINRQSSTQKYMIIVAVLSILFMVAGAALFIAGGVTAVTIVSGGFPTLIAVGFGVFFFGMIASFIGCCIVQYITSNRLEQLVATESAKYSTRSPTPCTWQFFFSRASTARYSSTGRSTFHRIIIEIGNAGGGGMRGGNVTNQGFQQTVNPFISASNNNNGKDSFCSQCGAPRQISAGRFCSQCGQQFNK